MKILTIRKLWLSIVVLVVAFSLTSCLVSYTIPIDRVEFDLVYYDSNKNKFVSIAATNLLDLEIEVIAKSIPRNKSADLSRKSGSYNLDWRKSEVKLQKLSKFYKDKRKYIDTNNSNIYSYRSTYNEDEKFSFFIVYLPEREARVGGGRKVYNKISTEDHFNKYYKIKITDPSGVFKNIVLDKINLGMPIILEKI